MFKALVFFTGVFTSLSAFAISDVSVVAGVNRATFKSTGGTAPGVTAQIGYNAGALVGFGSGPISLETGALYAHKKYKIFTRLVLLRADINAEITATYVQVPLVLRARMGFVTLGLGGYFSSLISGSASATIKVDGGPTLTVANATSGITDNDFGAIGLLRFNIVNTDTTGVFLDGRYLYGISDIDSSSTQLNNREIQAYAGLQFKLGK